MSRRRWIVLLGFPLILAAIAAPGPSGRLAQRALATSLAAPRPIVACPDPAPSAPGSGRAAVARAAGSAPAATVPGAWWRTDPAIDAGGTLTGWTLLVGTPGARASTTGIPAASTVTGPIGGRVVVASEGAAPADQSVVRIVDAAAGCGLEIHVADRIVRRAVADPAGDGVIAHLLEPGTRRDLGTWRVGPDGRAGQRILAPLPDTLREAAGIDRVWATDLRLDTTGRHLAIQSCHPDACVTRVVDLATGKLALVAGDAHGPIIGFAGSELVTWAACHGLPCPVVARDLRGGDVRTLVTDASGAALSGDGRRLLVVRPGDGDDPELVAIDVRTGAARSLGAAGTNTLPLSGAAGMVAGLEVSGSDAAIGHAGSLPVSVTIDETPLATTPPDREVLP